MPAGGSDFDAGGDFRVNPNTEDGNNVDEAGQRKTSEYVRALLGEKLAIDGAKHPIAAKLLDLEITRAQSEAGGTKREPKFLNVYRDKPVKVTCRVLVPLKEHPSFNFMGKLLGPKGAFLKRLQEETGCKMAILGRGSMRDKAKEEEFRKSLEVKYGHLLDDLHVEVSALAPPSEAYGRISYALGELQKCLTPDEEDGNHGPPFGQQQGGPVKRPGIRGPQRGPPRGPPRGGPPPLGPPRGPPSGGPPGRSNVMSLLGRARSSMQQQQQQQQHYDDDYEEQYESEQSFGNYSSGPPPSRFGSSNYEFGNDSFEENQRWKPFKAGGGGAAVRSEQPRFRPTPYTRRGK